MKRIILYCLINLLVSYQTIAQNDNKDNKEKEDEAYSAILDEEYKKIVRTFDTEFQTAGDKEDFRRLRDFRNSKADELLIQQTRLHYLLTFRKETQSDMDRYKFYLETFLNYIDDKPDTEKIDFSKLYGNEDQYWLIPRSVKEVKNKWIIPYKENIKKDSSNLAKAQSAIVITKYNVNLITDDLKKCDRNIDASLVPEIRKQQDRTSISLIFAGLVLLLMAMFFAVVYFRSDKDLSAILLTDGGLQFVTIFILIIAIILFGILNILEGRELAAIISGISGYILGRNAKIPTLTTTEKDKQEQPKEKEEEVPHELKVKA
jgi:hypothetical protein